MRFFTSIMSDPALAKVPKELRSLVVICSQSYFRGSVWRRTVDQILSGLCLSAICLAVMVGLAVGYFRWGYWGALGVMTICVAAVAFGWAAFFQFQLRRHLDRYLQTEAGQRLLRELLEL
jgi:CHASE2 domain-containing sensor protein